ncbi:MAG: hypothetical protein R3C32_15085 [Chloroflexota bacterium]
MTLVAIAVLNFVLFRLLPGWTLSPSLPSGVSAAQKDAGCLWPGWALDQPISPGGRPHALGGTSRSTCFHAPESLLHNHSS